jgi:methionyl-tRNA formyltransferase
MKKKCLFLGYKKNKTSLINFLKQKNYIVKNYQKIPSLKIFKENDFILLFGFRKIIPENIIKKLKKPIYNIHLSFLPFNRGAHPVLWSLINNTPFGVSIIEIDRGIDTGKIIFRKKININVNLKKYSTINKIYKYIFLKAEILFKKNFIKILKKQYKLTPNNSTKNDIHYKKDIPKIITNWNLNANLAKNILTDPS